MGGESGSSEARTAAAASPVRSRCRSASIRSLVRHGGVNGRYFRENFAQGGIDLVQIIQKLGTNADAAIAGKGRPSGRIVLRFGAPDPDFAVEWKRAMRRLRAPALLEWRHACSISLSGWAHDAVAMLSVGAAVRRSAVTGRSRP